jgi:hypothetical protein
MLRAAPAEQLEAVIARTTVPEEHRRAFLGTAAAVMLAAVGVAIPGCSPAPAVTGIQPDSPEPPERGSEDIGQEGETQPSAAPPESSNQEGGSPAETAPASRQESIDQRPERLPVTDGIRPDEVPVTKGIRPDRIERIGGVRPDRPPAPTGIRPDRPPAAGSDEQ